MSNNCYRVREISLVYGPRNQEFPKGEPISCPQAVSQYMDHLRACTAEHFVALHLDAKHHCIGVHNVSVGTLDGSFAHPRDVFQSAYLSNARALVLVHNHPSGNPGPSLEDVSTTHRMVNLGELHGVAVLDHIILGDPGYYSFQEAGQLQAQSH